MIFTMVDPGFPVGGVDLVGGGGGGGVDSRGSYISKILYVKMNLDPSGHVRRARPLDPPMSFISPCWIFPSSFHTPDTIDISAKNK